MANFTRIPSLCKLARKTKYQTLGHFYLHHRDTTILRIATNFRGRHLGPLAFGPLFDGVAGLLGVRLFSGRRLGVRRFGGRRFWKRV